MAFYRRVGSIFPVVLLGFFLMIYGPVAFASDDEESEPWEFYAEGFIEFENFLNTYEKQEIEDANVKNEVRAKLEVRYGEEYKYFYSTINAYFVSSLFSDELAQDYFYADEFEVRDNLQISSEDAEVTFNEFYFNYGRGNYRIRAGNQIYGWGTADVRNPTSYFNPMDMREMLFKGEDEMKLGVPSISTMIFMDTCTLEAVFVPFHLLSAFPPKESYWDFEFGTSGMDLVIDDYHALDKKLKNVGGGARLSTSLNGKDISVSCYHGPDVEVLMVPTRTGGAEVEPGAQFSSEIYIVVEPEYHLYDAVGIDFSQTFDKWVFQFEAIYSPNKWGLVEEEISDLESDEIEVLLPFETKKSHYVAVSTGVNYFVPVENFFENYDGMTVFTAEVAIAQFLNRDLYAPFLGNMIAMRLDSSFFEEKINISITGICDFLAQGVVVWPSVKYDFQNGLSTELSYADISGTKGSGSDTDNILYNIKNKDVLMWRIRYVF